MFKFRVKAFPPDGEPVALEFDAINTFDAVAIARAAVDPECRYAYITPGDVIRRKVAAIRLEIERVEDA